MPPPQDVGRMAQEKLIEQVHEVRPDLDVQGGFRATKGLSPTVVVLVASVGAMPFVFAAVLGHRPVLFLAALVVMALLMVVLVSVVNASRVVAETSDQLVVMAKEKGELVEIARHPKAVTLAPYWDRQWSKVTLGDETLWVSRRAFDETLERLSTDGAPSSDLD